MTSTVPDLEPLKTRRLTWLYVLALSLVAVLTTLGHLLVHQVLVRLEGDAGVVNLAGRQRMLSQRIPRVMLTLSSHDSNSDRDASATELSELLRQWNDAHRKLRGVEQNRVNDSLPTSESRALSPTEASNDQINSSAVRELFERIEPDFRALNQAARRLLGEVGRSNAAVQLEPIVMKAWMNHSDAFLKGMDEIVLLYEQDARSRVTRLQSIERGLVVATLLVLVCEGFFIFSPAVASLRKTFQQLQSVTRQLSAAKDQAEIANRAKTTLLTRVSHELRTPLHALLGMLSLVQRDKLGAMQVKRVRLSRQAAQSLSTLVDDLLDVAGIELGREPTIHKLPTRLDRLLKSSVELMRGVAEKKGLAVRFESELPSNIWIEIDPIRLRQVLVNLLQNAVRYTDAGSITCRARRNAERWEFEIADTGRGIDPTDQDRIFESFVRIDSDKAGEGFGQGLGLGLPITAGLVQAMNGSIELRSQLGQGTVVTIRFPFEPITPPPQRKTNRKPVIGSGKTAVVVDDSSVNRRLMKAYLQELRVRSKTFEDPEEALAFILRKRPDFVLLDRNLVRTDGLELAKRLRDASVEYHPKLFIITADIYLKMESLSPELRIAGLLYKPLDLDSLAKVLDIVVSSPSNPNEDDNYVELRSKLQTMVQAGLARDLDEMRQGLERKDMASLRLIAHRLYGSAGNAGLDELAESARGLEAAVDSADDTRMRKAFEELRKFIPSESL